MLKVNQDELGILGVAAPITALKIANVPFCVCDKAGLDSAVEELLNILGPSYPDVYIVPTETLPWDTEYFDFNSETRRKIGKDVFGGCPAGMALRFHFNDDYTFDTSVVGACELGEMITDAVKALEDELARKANK